VLIKLAQLKKYDVYSNSNHIARLSCSGNINSAQTNTIPTIIPIMRTLDEEFLLSSSLTPKSLLNASVSDLAKILGIDEYVAKLVTDAVSKAIKRSRSIP
jgi:hypothetical protein